MSTTRRLAAIALMTAVICLCSLLAVPAPVPFTLQTLGVFSALFLLGGRDGTCAVLLYLLLGCAGLPVFAGLQGSLSHLFTPTGGYLLGLLVCALVYLLVTALGGKALLAAVLGQLSCYLVGAAWFLLYSRTSLLFALWVGVVPFLLPDALKLALAYALKRRLTKHLT